MPQLLPLRADDPRRVGRYHLTGRLTGIPSADPIYLAAGPEGAEVAISVLQGDWARDAAARDRFAAEAAGAKRVPPFCAARVLDAGLAGNSAYLVSEYVAGQSLLELIAGSGVRTGADLEAVAIGMATGLASVHHANLVHGNFGPEYLIVPVEGPPRVVEYGITPPYGAATPAADMFAWAQTVVFAASGSPPAGAADLAVLPRGVHAAVRRCLDPDPSERPSARSVVLALLGGTDITAGVLAAGTRRATRPTSSQHPHGRELAVPSHHEPGPAPQANRHARPSDERTPAHATGAGAVPRRAASRHQAMRGGRRTGALVTGLIVAVVVLVGAAILLLTQNHRTPSASRQRLTDNSRATGRRSASASSAGRGDTPAAFAGSWSGRVTQPPVDIYRVTVTLTAGAAVATVSYSGTSTCSGSLTLTSATSTKLIMTEAVASGPCKNGTVTVTLISTRSLWFSFQSTGPAATGRLTRN